LAGWGQKRAGFDRTEGVKKRERPIRQRSGSADKGQRTGPGERKRRLGWVGHWRSGRRGRRPPGHHQSLHSGWENNSSEFAEMAAQIFRYPLRCTVPPHTRFRYRLPERPPGRALSGPGMARARGEAFASAQCRCPPKPRGANRGIPALPRCRIGLGSAPRWLPLDVSPLDSVPFGVRPVLGAVRASVGGRSFVQWPPTFGP
jgi:hypothetical protein